MQATKRCSLGQDFVLVAEAKHKVLTVPKAKEIKSSMRLSVSKLPMKILLASWVKIYPSSA